MGIGAGFLKTVGLIGVVVAAAACSGDQSPAIGSAYAAIQACQCSGVGFNGPVTINCGQTTCGTDSYLYMCTDTGFVPTGNACNAPADMATPPSDGGCSCSGTGANGPVTLSCGQTTCGTDNNTYECTASGFVPFSQGCSSPPDLAHGVDAGNCSCSGTGHDGPVTISCGQTTCGTDSNTYECTASGFVPFSQGCSSQQPDMAQSGNDAGSCSCSGVGINGPVTRSCGGTTCGTDYNTYQCTPGGWSSTGVACTGQEDMASSCSCSGTGINGPVTVACGQTTCGTDSNTYECTPQGFTPFASGCSSTPADMANQNCSSCSGVGINGPVTISCGQITCGTDHNFYSCNNGTFSPTGQACTGNEDLATPGPDLAQPPCQCSGVGFNGPVTISCGQQTCGTDSNLYMCTDHGFVPTGNACPS